jgi:hypothetical protein
MIQLSYSIPDCAEKQARFRRLRHPYRGRRKRRTLTERSLPGSVQATRSTPAEDNWTFVISLGTAALFGAEECLGCLQMLKALHSVTGSTAKSMCPCVQQYHDCLVGRVQFPKEEMDKRESQGHDLGRTDSLHAYFRCIRFSVSDQPFFFRRIFFCRRSFVYFSLLPELATNLGAENWAGLCPRIDLKGNLRVYTVSRMEQQVYETWLIIGLVSNHKPG